MTRKTVIRNFSMHEDFSKVIDQVAKELGMNYSEFVRQAIRRYIRYIKGGGRS